MKYQFQNQRTEQAHAKLTSSLSWKAHKISRFVSWIAFPIAGFMQGLSYIAQQSDDFNKQMFDAAALVALFAIIVRICSSYLLHRNALKIYAEYFDAMKIDLPEKRIIDPDSILIKDVFSWNFGYVAATSDTKETHSMSIIYNETLRVKQLSRHTGVRSSFLVFSFELPKNAPHIFIDSKNNNLPLIFNRSLWTLHYRMRTPDRNQKLEGDFPNYFDIYAPPNQQIEVLSILTPDVMERLKDHVRNFDVEVVNNRLYIICETNAITLNSPTNILGDMKFVYEEILHQVKTSGTKRRTKKTLQVIDTKVGALFYGSAVLSMPLFIGFIAMLTLVGLIPGVILGIIIEFIL